ncbi:(2E,6E)-farnesyl diphosphate synthase [Oceanisphaera avium]|uniref:(2E,6E)-farnesyl diphosphate synthase n=1 Tax=Oceanisphaera avium TaxID=1903694 RepID=A0A1Y0CWZ7_9GAMM|nr:(2E,6E)-farnesyl diphosphate synthase [Oceanisphaera avium]ART79860.1 (2E,6E)-farnesyl diphosphate synthase [Oceanisphaera avium]
MAESLLQAQYQARIKEVLATTIARLTPLAPTLRAAMEYGLLRGGKRVRPLLVYASGELLSQSGASCNTAALDAAAAAIECIHAYSLIHDDLPAMDDDDLRRGEPTVHKAFDEATAILAGDALQALAFELLSQANLGLTPARQLRMIQELSLACGYQGMCGGQALDIQYEGQSIERAALEELHRHKTGALIVAAVRLGALCVEDMQEAHLSALSQYAHAIGLAFQVQDDILDITADTQTLGKTQGKDIMQQKSTYPALLGLDGARQLAEQLLAQALAALADIPYSTQTLEAFAHYIVKRDF